MLQNLKNWWNKDKLKQAELDNRLQALEASLEQKQTALGSTVIAMEQVEEKLQEAEDQLTMYRKQEEADDARRNGTEPWVEVRSANLDPVKGIQIELDWNEAFVQYLKDNGLTGRDDETIVQKWLAFLYEELINRLETQSVDKSDIKKVSDFV